MAKDKKPTDPLNNETNLSIYADHLGLTPDFIKRNRDKLDRIEKQVEISLRDTNRDDPSTIFDTMNVLKRITEMTYVSDAYENNLNVSTVDRGSLDTRDGFRMIYGEATSLVENVVDILSMDDVSINPDFSPSVGASRIPLMDSEFGLSSGRAVEIHQTNNNYSNYSMQKINDDLRWELYKI